MTRIERAPFEMVLGNRQLAAILILLAFLMGVIGSIAYVAGRLVGPVQAQVAADPLANQSAMIVVDPLPLPAKAQADPPAPRLIQPASGQVFLQVAAVDRGMAEVTAQYLARKGFDAGIAFGATPNEFRVLISTGNDAIRTRARLEDSGFHSFVRKF